jgi:hypothetical protein
MELKEAMEAIKNVLETLQPDHIDFNVDTELRGEVDGCNFLARLINTKEDLKTIDDKRQIIVGYAADFVDEPNAEEYKVGTLYELCWCLHSQNY